MARRPCTHRSISDDLTWCKRVWRPGCRSSPQASERSHFSRGQLPRHICPCFLSQQAHQNASTSPAHVDAVTLPVLRRLSWQISVSDRPHSSQKHPLMTREGPSALFSGAFSGLWEDVLLPRLSAVDLFRLSCTCRTMQLWLLHTPNRLWQVGSAWTLESETAASRQHECSMGASHKHEAEFSQFELDIAETSRHLAFCILSAAHLIKTQQVVWGAGRA